MVAKKQRKTNTLTKEPAPGGKPGNTRVKWLICLLLVIVTLVAYWQVFGCKFIDCYDDRDYVTDNVYLAKGLGTAGLQWAFTTFRCANWHPLTWLSLMLDHQLYIDNPAGFHFTNLLFHIAGSLILFLVLSRITGSEWKSGFVAALFAVHPLHVESVAWVAERKDVLSTFFCFLTIYAYLGYVSRPTLKRYLLILLAFVLGLLAKPMLVSVPLVLLLLDYWPLRRTSLKWKLIWEKAPLLVLSAGSCVVTLVAQRAGGAVTDLRAISVGCRIGNAAVSYVAYLVKMVWPSKLAVFYPHPAESLPVWQICGATVVLALISLYVIKERVRKPYLAIGWLWYVITLLPVIGLVQVGGQAMADRYTYIPLVGVFMMIAWGVPDLLAKRPSASRGMAAAAAAVVAAMVVCTWVQVRFWQDSFTLFDHAIAVTQNNSIAHNNRGAAFVRRSELDHAIDDFSKATEIEPNYGEAHSNLALALIESGKTDEGIDHAETALSLGWDKAISHYALALGYWKTGRRDLSAEQCDLTLKRDPKYAACHNLLGMLLGSQHKMDEAISHLQSAADFDPTYAAPHGNLAIAYFSQKDYVSAWKEVHQFESLGGQPNPGFVAALSQAMPDPGQ